MDDTNHDTYDQIQRYLQNRMSKGEMHDFEKAMLDDPFLSDALEGFKVSNPTLVDKHLQYIADNIAEGEQKARGVPMENPIGRWLKVAASIIVIGGASLLAYQWFGTSKTKQPIAEVAQTPAATTVDSVVTLAAAEPATPATSSKINGEELARNSYKPAVQNQPAYDAATIMQAPTTYVPADTTAKAPAGQLAGAPSPNTEVVAVEAIMSARARQETTKQMPPAALSLMTKRIQGLTPGNNFKGKVVDPGGQPVAFATIMTNEKDGVITDRNGDFSITTGDSIVTVNVQSVGFESLVQTLTPVVTNQLILQPAQQSLADVVVTGMSANRRAGAASKKVTLQTEIEPANGWANYMAYVAKSVKTIQDTSTSYLSGQVNLSFIVNKKGEPQQITIVSSTNAANNPLSVAIVQQGPLWTYRSKIAKAFLTISF